MKRTISEAEARFIEGGVAVGVRNDGRKQLDVRPIEVETGVVATANGSARVRVGGCAPLTEVLVGVKAELSEPRADSPNRGCLHFGVQVATDASGGGAEEAEDTAMEVCRAVARIVGDSASLDLAQLCVVPGRRCWELCVDALVLSRGAGALVDAVGIAVRAALATTRLPRVEVLEAESGDGAAASEEDLELEVDDDPEAARLFNASGVPVCVTLSRVGSQTIADATAQEEACASARLVVGVTPSGAVCGLHKVGRGGLSPSSLPEMLRAAQRIGLATISALNDALRREAS